MPLPSALLFALALEAWVLDRGRIIRPPSSSASTPVASRASVVRRVSSEGAVAVLTFDACATRTQANGFDRALYQLLVRERVPVTVFVSGRWVETHPADFAELAANPLVDFGNHSYDHPHMTQLDDAAITAEVARTNALIAAHGRKAIAFRPPYGDIDEHVVQVVRRVGLPTVTWDVVSGDPGKRATRESIEKQVTSHARPGSIIIFHINGRAPHTVEALPAILANLRARGFTFAPLSRFLGASS